MKFRNFGKKSMNEIETLIEKVKLNFGMDVTKFGIEPKPKKSKDSETGSETETETETEKEELEDYEA